MKSVLFIAALCLFFQISYSQDGLPFQENKKLYLHGNSILIGNNILGDHPTKPLMERNTPNDLVAMKYIDVDNDRATFSSSEATIANAPNNPKIKYAGLYWSGLYPFKKGILKKSGNQMTHAGRGNRDEKVNAILLKKPNGNYEPIEGQVIYDSHKTEAFKTNKPYVCYANITAQLQDQTEINGTYTIANVKATEGKISGGGAAGWLLYIVYEDENESPKYFNTYNGLIEVSKEKVELSFKDFKNKDEGNIQTTIAIGALEGDRKIKTDQVSVYNQNTEKYIPLHNTLRAKRNFFNSSITIGNETFNERNPNSANTLGFDLLKMEIPNKDNALFNSATTEANFIFHGKADRFYLFFIAFETEIDNTFLLEKTEPLANIPTAEPVYKIQKSSNGTVVLKRVASIDTLNKPAKQDDPKVLKTPQIKASKEPVVALEEASILKDTVALEDSVSIDEDAIRNETKIKTISAPEVEPGYYIITNVFSVENYAAKWIETLEQKNYTPATFINPENKWTYVYIAKNSSLKTIYKKWIATKDHELFENSWILEVKP
ncbi:hypothetical protein [Aequorivita marina]|uniref:hypothetical protein n=1 Tax=Aequorivita marina TaxID=3073654 RepID=UPI002876FB0D|nr:hypothetical protein [Aequorivita sp. S2608]MDS1298894.1 hypothetical protein [Aequorivita sp. S2608]